MGEKMNDEVVVIRPKDVQPLKVGSHVYKSVYDWELTEKDLEKAARELGETEEKKKECLRKLKEKLSNETKVRYRQDDSYLLRFLRVRKFDVEKAYQNIKSFFQQRKKHPEIFTLPSELKSVQALNWFNILPYANEDGSILFLLNFNRWNPHERTFDEIIQSAFTVFDLGSMNPRCQINGAAAIWNFEGITMRHISDILWNGRWMALIPFAHKGYPYRISKWIIVNTNGLVRFLFSFIRPLLPRKLRERVIFLGSDMNELHDHMNLALLPKRFKGTLEEEECDTSQHVLDNLAYLRYERSFIFD